MILASRRILILEDEPEIAQTYRDFLLPASQSKRQSSRGSPTSNTVASSDQNSPQISEDIFELTLVSTGEAALEIIRQSIASGERFAGGFFDVKLGIGIDGVQTVKKIWEIDPDFICTFVTAYHDRSVQDIDSFFQSQHKDQWDYLNKPFNHAEIIQKARQMVAQWNRFRMLEFTQAQLVQSEKMAALGQLARSIGHEFGNLLQAILSKTELAMRENTDASVGDRLSQIKRAAERATAVIRNLQNFSRSSPDRSRVLFDQLVREVLILLNHELKKNKIVVQEESAAGCEVWVNSTEIEQVLLNLMLNAVHAMPSGGTLSIGCKAEGEQVVGWVRDSGTGIKKEILERIFDFAFTTKGEQGSGLGLAISKEIIEKHSGTVSVQSEEGKGSEFRILLPRSQRQGI